LIDFIGKLWHSNDNRSTVPPDCFTTTAAIWCYWR